MPTTEEENAIEFVEDEEDAAVLQEVDKVMKTNDVLRE